MGVALGVSILIVVMSVMDGFELEVKKNLLSFSPHISLNYYPNGNKAPIDHWKKVVDDIKKEPGISQVSGSIQDNAIIEYNGDQVPILYRGINSEDPDQVQSIEKILTDSYGASSADMGLEDKAVIRDIRARQLGIEVGDVIQLYSTRNFDEVFDAYKRTERPRASDQFQDEFATIISTLKAKKISGAPQETFHINDLQKVYDQLIAIQESGIRAGESSTLDTVLDMIYDAKKLDEVNRQLPKGATEHIEQLLTVHLAEIDNTADDNAELKKLKSIVLPKDVKIVGVYRISQQVYAPDFFLPLPLAQELSGLDSGVDQISIRLDDMDAANEVYNDLVHNKLELGWAGQTWMEEHRYFFKIVLIQEGMMALVLSIVALGAAFLITIVMFLTALQKKKEIGVMLAVGAKPGQICSIFFIQGILIGVVGVILGIAFGMLVLHFRLEIQQALGSVGFDIFNAEFTGLESLPAHTTAKLVAWVSIMALVMCSLAPLLPALFAARNDPAKSLRDL